MNTPKLQSISLSTLPGALAVVVALTGVVALVAPLLARARVSELRTERGWSATPAETQQVRASQADRIAHYAWIDRAHGVVALPIERAMELSVQDMNAPHPGKDAPR